MRIDGELSEPKVVKSGVPQGSVSGPMLFLIYINDLPEEISSNINLFADDSTIYKGVNEDEDIKQLQNDLINLEKWCNKWKMHINPKKTFHMEIGKTPQPSSAYNINGQPLHKTEKLKCVGVTIDKNLTWKCHVEDIVKSAKSMIGFIGRTLRGTDFKVKEQVYNSLVRSKLNYASAAWDPNTKEQINAMEKVEKAAMRNFKGIPWKEPNTCITAHLRQEGWKTLRHTRQFRKLKVMKQIYESKTILDRQSFCPTPVYMSRTDNEAKILRETWRTNYRNNSFGPSTIKTWNKLPTGFLMSSKELFKKKCESVLGNGIPVCDHT